jgi:hypothetical protein
MSPSLPAQSQKQLVDSRENGVTVGLACASELIGGHRPDSARSLFS